MGSIKTTASTVSGGSTMGVVAKAVSDFILFISNKTVLSTGAAVVLGGKKQQQKPALSAH